MEVVWQVEKDAFCRRVLAKHWPEVTRYEDVHDVGAHNLAPVDLICGGFPCQDVSYSGKRAGIQGSRSGLWSEYARIVREVRPHIVLVENVTGLLTAGLGTVVGCLAEIGYDAEWDCIPASAIGAPHGRDRVFVVAYPKGEPVQKQVLASPTRLPRESRRVGRPRVSGDYWEANQPSMVGMAYGDAGYVDVARALGNAVVPQVSEWIGRRIMEAA